MWRRLRKLGRHEKGASAVEYSLIVALIALAVLGGMRAVAGETLGLWRSAESNVAASM